MVRNEWVPAHLVGPSRARAHDSRGLLPVRGGAISHQHPVGCSGGASRTTGEMAPGRAGGRSVAGDADHDQDVDAHGDEQIDDAEHLLLVGDLADQRRGGGLVPRHHVGKGAGELVREVRIDLDQQAGHGPRRPFRCRRRDRSTEPCKAAITQGSASVGHRRPGPPVDDAGLARCPGNYGLGAPGASPNSGNRGPAGRGRFRGAAFTSIGGGALWRVEGPLRNAAARRRTSMPESTLSVWTFDTPDGAERAVGAIQDMHSQKLLTILDYATVSWQQDTKKPTSKRGSPTTSTAALGGDFWGMLFGLIFFVPLLGVAVGAAAGGFAGSMADVGIDDGFIKKVRTKVTPGTSALFLLTSRSVPDIVKDRFAADHPSEPTCTHLSEEQDSALRRVFGDGAATSRPRASGRVAPASGARARSTTTLTVWHYNSAMGASAGEVRLRDLEQRRALTVIDAITVLWVPATLTPRIGRFRSRTGARARRGAVLGALADTLVLAPVDGAGGGALAGRLRQAGIGEEFLREVEGRLVPGSSALLVLSENTDLDAIRPILERGRSRGDVTLMHAVLHDDAPRALHDLLDVVPPYRPHWPAAEDLEPAGSALPSQRSASSSPSHQRKETP